MCDVQTSSESEDGIGSPANEDIGSCELPDMVLGTKLRFCQRVGSSLNCWTISPPNIS